MKRRRDNSRQRVWRARGIRGPGGLRLVERGVVIDPEGGAADRGEDVVVIVVAQVEGQVPEDPLDRARPDERASTAGADAMVNGLLGEVLDQMPSAAAGELRFGALAGVPKPRDVGEPEVGGLDVHEHRPDPLLDVRVALLALVAD